MNTKLVATAAQADADLCNLLEPPAQGAPAGGGAHVVIPADWATRILGGQQVPGCTYYMVETAGPFAGSLTVGAVAQAQLANPSVTNALSAPQKAQAAALNAKLAAASIVP